MDHTRPASGPARPPSRPLSRPLGRLGLFASALLLVLTGLSVSAGPAGAAPASAAAAAPIPVNVAVTASAATLRYGAPVMVTFALSGPNGAVVGGRTVHIGWRAGSSGAVDVTTDSAGRGRLRIAGGQLAAGRTLIVVTPRGQTAPHGSVLLTVLPRPTTVAVTASRTTFGTGARVSAQIALATGILPAGGAAKVDLDGHTQFLVPVPRTGRIGFTLPWSAGVGRHLVGVTYYPAGGSNAARSRGTAAMTVTRVAPRWTVTLPAGRPAYGAVTSVTLGVVAPHALARGVVTLQDGGTMLGRAALAGRATVTFRVRVNPSVRTLIARSSGDATVAPSHTVFRVGVVRALPSVTVTPLSAVSAGSTSTVRVQVRGALTAPSGVVVVYIDGRPAASGLLLSGSATLTVPMWSQGAHTLFAGYRGDARFVPRLSGKSVVQASANPCPPTARACVDLTHRTTWLQSGGRVSYGPVSITSGRAGYRTYAGSFQVYYKDANHHSSEFNGAPMPNSVFFDGGIAFHAGSLSVQSHGCIHLSFEASQVYFDTLSLGDQVYVFGAAPY